MTQFLKFTAVGCAATITTFIVLIVLVEWFNLHAILGSCAGYLAGAAVNYALNYRYTFNSTKRHRDALPRFTVILAVGILLNTALMFWAVTVLSMHYLLAQLIAVAVVLFWSYTANRLWAFA